MAAEGIDRPLAILFDWDNTLVDNWVSIRGALNATLVAMGLRPWTMEEVMAGVRVSAREGFPDLFGDRWREAMDVFYKHFEKMHIESLRTMPGAQALLEMLAASDFHLGVVSNKHGDFLRKEAAHLGWDAYFARIVGANDAARDKPEPDPIHLALADSGIAAGRGVWYVGDAAVDILCAHNAGCVAVLIGDGHGDAGAGQADLHLSDCAALAKLFQEPYLK